jgi:flagellar biosynthesis/type III secretory pathway protein FliH
MSHETLLKDGKKLSKIPFQMLLNRELAILYAYYVVSDGYESCKARDVLDAIDNILFNDKQVQDKCDESYNEGYDEAYDTGYDAGYDEGKNE